MMRNYRAWVKQQGQRFLAEVRPVFEKDAGPHGGASPAPDFLAWLEENDALVQFAARIGAEWGPREIQFVNSHSPNREQQAVSRQQAVDAFVRDLSRVVRQLWRKGSPS